MDSRARPKPVQRRNTAGASTGSAEPRRATRGSHLADQAQAGLEAIGRSDRVWVLGLMTAYAALYAFLSIVKYRYYLYTDFDLAIFAHAVERVLHGSLFESIGGMDWLGGHVSPVLFLTAPLYALFRHPITLLILQSAALALGAWPVFQLARREIGAGFAPVGLAALYLIYPALGYLNLFEFHPEAFATPALLFSFSALRSGNLGRTLVWAALALTTREDVALVVLAMAAHALVIHSARGRVFAAALAGLALTSLLLSFALVLPYFGSGQTDYGSIYANWGANAREVFANLISHLLQAFAELFVTAGNNGDSSVKLQYHLHLLLPVAFLALASPSTLLIALPVLCEHLLSSRSSQHSIVFHYTALIIPFYLSATVIGIGNLSRLRLRRAAASGLGSKDLANALVLAALTFSVGSNFLFGPLLGRHQMQAVVASERFWPNAQDRTLKPYRDRMVERVPSGAGIVTSFEYLAHFVAHENLYSFHHLYEGRYTFSTRTYRPPERIDAMLTALGDQYDPKAAERVRQMILHNDLRPVAAANDLLLYLRGARDSIDLMTTSDFGPSIAANIVYDGQLAFLGSDTLAARVRPGGSLILHTYWRRGPVMDREFLTRLWLYDEQEHEVFYRSRYLGYATATASRWPQGQTMRETYQIVLPDPLPRGALRLVMQVAHVPPRAGEMAIPNDPKLLEIGGFLLLGSVEPE